MPKKLTPPSKGRIVLAVLFDQVPDDDAVRDLMDAARGVGSIEQADLQTFAPLKRDLLQEGW